MATKGQKFMSYDDNFREQVVQDYLKSILSQVGKQLKPG